MPEQLVLEQASGKTLRSIGGTSPTDLWAVGDEGVVLRRTVSGSVASWSVVPSGTTGNLQSVWSATAGDLWIVGTTGALRSKGTPGTAGFTFVAAKPPAALLDGLTGLYRVWGTDAKNVWMVGPDPCLDPDAVCEYGEAHVLRYGTLADGGPRWSRVDIGTNPFFNVGIAGGAATPDNEIVVAGYEYLNGCIATSPIGADAGDAGITWNASGVCFRQRGVWMRTAAQGWSVGTDGLAQEWDGKKWHPARLTITAVPIANHLYSVRGARASSGTELWIVGDGIALHRHLNP